MLYATVFNRIITLVSQLFIGVLLSPEEVGKFAIAASVCTLLSLFQSADLTRISLQATDDLERNGEAIKNWLLVGCTVILILIYIGQSLLPANIDRGFVLILALLPFLRVMANSRTAVLSAHEGQTKIAIASAAEGVARAVGVVGLAWLGWGSASLVASEFVAISVSVLLLNHWTPLKPKTSWWIDLSIRPKLIWTSLSNVLMQVDREYSTFVIGALSTVSAAGSFFFANRIAGQIAVILGPLVVVEVIPRLIKAIRSGTAGDYRRIKKAEARRLALIGAPIAAFLAIAAPIALWQVWGDRWLDAAKVLPIITIAAVLRVLYGFYRAELEAFGGMRDIFFLSTVDAVLLLVFQPLGAYYGAAIGTAGVMLVESALIVIVSDRLVRRRSLEFKFNV